ncbi:MAG: 2-C-methyl-D-erythritol 4-phosphate cytidylyltransferase [Acidaminococcales bacterium]|jgi:2-C-methyl-D-erythritol 4-phosphate cytidylyltransferase|nr:2-C-methyl-D-erythritol 4-phosphate cytidylyltransferase [Acidaminococcales bacterium]
MGKLHTILPAAGRGLRLGAGVNKMYIKIGDLPVLVCTLKALNACSACEAVTVAAAPEELAHVRELLAEYRKFFPRLVCAAVPGGETRQRSVGNALKQVPADCEFVAIHDGARPLIAAPVFERVLAAAHKTGAAIAAAGIHDTVKFVRNNLIESTADRAHVMFAQTPQIFSRKIIADAYAKAENEGFFGTDDASLVENVGYRVAVAEGDPCNIKITTAMDIFLAEKLLGGE